MKETMRRIQKVVIQQRGDLLIVYFEKNARAYSDIYPCRNFPDQMEIRKHRAMAVEEVHGGCWIMDTSFDAPQGELQKLSRWGALCVCSNSTRYARCFRVELPSEIIARSMRVLSFSVLQAPVVMQLHDTRFIQKEKTSAMKISQTSLWLCRIHLYRKIREVVDGVLYGKRCCLSRSGVMHDRAYEYLPLQRRWSSSWEIGACTPYRILSALFKKKTFSNRAGFKEGLPRLSERDSPRKTKTIKFLPEVPFLRAVRA